MRLLLDEHLDLRLAEALRRRGHDVIAVTEEAARRGSSDASLLDWAATQDRVVVTYNVRHFLPLLEERVGRMERMAGLILISARSYPPSERGFGQLLQALAAALDAHPSATALSDRAIWL